MILQELMVSDTDSAIQQLAHRPGRTGGHRCHLHHPLLAAAATGPALPVTLHGARYAVAGHCPYLQRPGAALAFHDSISDHGGLRQHL